MPMEPVKLSPDELLAYARDEDAASTRGRLTVFLGYAAGVGKTFTMLEAANEKRREGVDVVVGLVETHGRAETEALLDGLTVLPRAEYEYRGTRLSDLDLDGLLKRAPRIAVVDELAHTNAPGARHTKRHMDVEELLAAGIEVYTTLNIQHIESLNDIVARITGITMHETVPDTAFRVPFEVVTVDVTPDELRERLHAGKVYVPQQAGRAMERFFRGGNLTALRELALRYAARSVDDQMRSYMRLRSIAGPWAATERLLVCVGPSPLSARLVRTAKRLSDDMQAEWVAAHVETSASGNMSEGARERVGAHLALAESLGAQIVTLAGESVAFALAECAVRMNITKIVVGRPMLPRWREIIRGSLVDQLVRLSGPIDIYVITNTEEPSRPMRARPLGGAHALMPYVWGAIAVVLATLIGLPFRDRIDAANLVMPYLAAVVISGLRLGRGPAVFSSLLGVVAFDVTFIHPYGSLAVHDTQYLITFAGLLVVGLTVSTLVSAVRGQVGAARLRASQMAALSAMGQHLSAMGSATEIADSVVQQVAQTFGGDAWLMLSEGDDLEAIASTRPEVPLPANEAAVASWAVQHGKWAGWGTDTLPSAEACYVPLRIGEDTIGVIGVAPGEKREGLRRSAVLLESMANLAVVALSRARLAAQARQAEVLSAADRIQSALLSCISHELRTPLASITGVLSSLRGQTEHRQHGQSAYDPESEREMVDTALSEATRLNQLVQNLLGMTRIEAGRLTLRREPCDLVDLLGAAIDQLGDRLDGDRLVMAIPADLPMAALDAVLFVQVLANLLENASRYAPAGTPIEVGAEPVPAGIRVRVSDRGPGVPDEELGPIFEKFHRVGPAQQVGGTGLGLAIARGVVEAHGGRIWAGNRPGGGLSVLIDVPLEAQEASVEGSP